MNAPVSPPEISPGNIKEKHRRTQIAYAIAWGSMVLALVVIGWSVIGSFAALNDLSSEVKANGDSFSVTEYFSEAYTEITGPSLYRIWLALFALAALGRLAYLIARPSQWGN